MIHSKHLYIYILHLKDTCSGRKQKNSNLKTWTEYYPEMFVDTCDKSAVIYETTILILASVEAQISFTNPLHAIITLFNKKL